MRAARGALASVLPSAFLGIPILGLRLRPPGGRALHAIGVHAFRALVFAVLATALWLGIVAVETAALGLPFRTEPRVIGGQLTISLLLYAVVAATAQARRDTLRVAEAQALRARAELQALRSQLNPHFVLNALHTLHALVRTDPGRAEHAIEELGRLLSYGLRQQREDVDEATLAEEWAFVTDYTRIEELRFGERLHVVLDAGPGASVCRLPPFSIQPLVENAIVHAIGPRAAGGTVSVAARRDGDSLRVMVTDDGAGLAPSPNGGMGMGLRLIEQRLHAIYGTTARLTLEAPPEGGTRAVLEVPQRDDDREPA